MRRDDICLYLGPADRAERQALIANRNTPRKPVWRAEIVLAINGKWSCPNWCTQQGRKQSGWI